MVIQHYLEHNVMSLMNTLAYGEVPTSMCFKLQGRCEKDGWCSMVALLLGEVGLGWVPIVLPRYLHGTEV
jgi:hypothetical protein